MISYDQLLDEMERRIQAARSERDEQMKRAQLTAIQALCNAALAQSSSSSMTVERPAATFVSTPGPPQTTVAPPLSSERLEEDGANGASIFDF